MNKKTMELVDSSTKSMDVIMQKAEAIANASRDYNIPAKRISMNPNGTLHFVNYDGGVELKDLPLSRHACGQLCTRTGVPYSYLERCLNNNFGVLASTNVNTWLEQTPDKRFLIRTTSDKVRGFLSQQYKMCDTPELLDIVSRYVPETEWEIKGSYIDEERTHLRFVEKHEMKVDGNIFFALFLDTSDVGKCGIHLRFGFYRLACTNGMIVNVGGKEAFYQPHLGMSARKVADNVAAFMAEVPSKARDIEDRIRRAQNISVNPDSDEVRASIRYFTKLRDDEVDQVLLIAQKNYWDNRWGVVNAITEYAQQKTLTDRLSLEVAAGRLLSAS